MIIPYFYYYYSFLKVVRIKYRVLKIENIKSCNSLKYTNYLKKRIKNKKRRGNRIFN